jgi:hypothetical protein
MDKISQRPFQEKFEKKYLFVHDDLRNTFYFRQFLILSSFVPTLTGNAKLTPKVLGQLAQQSLVLWNQSSISFYTVLTLILRQPHCVGLIGLTPPFLLSYCVGPIGPTPPPPPHSAGGTQPPAPFPGRVDGARLDNFIILVGPIAQHAVG